MTHRRRPSRPGGSNGSKQPAWRLLARVACVVVMALIWLPAAIFAAGLAIARLGGCHATEAGPEPCLIAGADIGHTLYGMLMMGWVVILALPFMLLSLIAVLVFMIRRARRRRAIARGMPAGPAS